ncbi:HK97-gp10 family putative phage morphogenesis protein [Salipiger marinus]|uniref:Phage protein, HK97 gp10 family n=1 Tax=Salipiger marinus TaxID=555512 RepID=A0A1G8PTP7_9RHOB|nr:HK97-gp10 family putative phage morphogenesis protein [Salipiger marinus]SDI95823.1 phage protein, HK97 gp10 family [Salipiger marinus]
MPTKILNLARLDRKLKRLPTATKTRIRAAMEKGADKIVAMMKRLAPSSSDGSHGQPPGTLRDSIGWTWGQAPKGSFAIATLKGAGVGGDLTLTIYAGSTIAFYARWLEFGTTKMPASPYFYVSWRAYRKEVRREVRKAVRDAARATAQGG